MTNGVWHHIAVTLSSAASRIYRDGTLLHEDSAITPGLGDTDRVVMWGRNNQFASNAQGYNGRLSRCAIWKVDLTATEIASLAKGASPYIVRPTDLIAFLPWFGLASPEVDLSGNALNATMTGTVSASTSEPPVAALVPLAY